MIKVTRTQIRPNTDVAFYEPNQQFVYYRENTYISTGKRLSNTYTYSQDLLTVIAEIYYKDQASLDEFNNDARVIAFHFEPRNTYNQANGITSNEQVSVI